MAREEKSLISRAYEDTTKNAQDLLRRTSGVLSQFCKQAGVVLWPKLTLSRFRHIQFIRLRQGRILAILITESGLAHQSLLEMEEDIGQDDLDKYSRYINELLHDIPFGDIKQRLLDEMQKEKVLFDQLYRGALEISRRVFQSNLEGNDVYIEGQTNLLDSPEFADVERMRRILTAFENKSRIVRLLDGAIKSSSKVQIILGPESELNELREISLITSPYTHGGNAWGVLGVIGPLRMDYSRIVPIVEFTAILLSELLEESEEA
jgi:heat-inducible transcriptional repressor